MDGPDASGLDHLRITATHHQRPAIGGRDLNRYTRRSGHRPSISPRLVTASELTQRGRLDVMWPAIAAPTVSLASRT